jgi:hypothetical protein
VRVAAAPTNRRIGPNRISSRTWFSAAAVGHHCSVVAVVIDDVTFAEQHQPLSLSTIYDNTNNCSVRAASTSTTSTTTNRQIIVIII